MDSGGDLGISAPGSAEPQLGSFFPSAPSGVNPLVLTTDSSLRESLSKVALLEIRSIRVFEKASPKLLCWKSEAFESSRKPLQSCFAGNQRHSSLRESLSKVALLEIRGITSESTEIWKRCGYARNASGPHPPFHHGELCVLCAIPALSSASLDELQCTNGRSRHGGTRNAREGRQGGESKIAAGLGSP